MKVCKKCLEAKPLGDFHRNCTSADGRQTFCKSCHTIVNREWRERNPDKARAMKRRTYERHGPKPDPSTREEKQARRLLQTAIRNGTVVRPGACSHCDTACTPHGHHADYGRALDVVWLCGRCHMRLHAGLIVLEPTP